MVHPSRSDRYVTIESASPSSEIWHQRRHTATHIWANMCHRREVDEYLRHRVRDVREDFGYRGDLEARPDDDQQVHLLPVAKQALVKLGVQRLAKEGNVGLGLEHPPHPP